MKIALLIPALNEAATIASVVEKASRYGTVIVVDDGSSDNTGAIATAQGAIVVTHPENHGYDGALASGFRTALEQGFDAVITLDADGQHNPDILKDFITALDGGADLVLGFRPKPARITEGWFRHYARFRFGIKDILCGMKGYKAELLRRHIGIADAPTIGTGVTLQAARQKIVITQLAVPVYPRADTPRLGRALKANWLIFKAMVFDFTL